MLASTMQHSTHNHTPTSSDHHHTEPVHPVNALDDQGQEQPYQEEPNRCLLRTQQCAKPMKSGTASVSCSTQPRSTRAEARSRERGIRDKDNHQLREPAVYPTNTVRLLRKEVIQPHLPVRLPCYDFVPIAGPTFDSSLHKGWATGFGCYRLS